MKILFITQEFTLSSGSSGGAGVYAYELTKTLAENGVEVHVMAPAHRTYQEQLTPNLIIHWQKSLFKPLMLMPSFHLQVLAHAGKIIKTHSITSIHSNDYAASLVIKRRPSVAMIHHPVSSEMATTTSLQRLLNLPDLLLEKVVTRHADIITVPSHLVLGLLIKHYPLVAPKAHITINGVDLKTFKATGTHTVRAHYHLDRSDLVAFFPGGARAKRKGALTLVQALAQADLRSRLRILISGTSREAGWEQELADTIRQANLESTFIWVGELGYDELPRYIEAADFTIYPSHFEGFGLPVLESLAVGRPVISTRTGEIPYLLNDQNGIVVEPGDTPQLAAALARLAGDQALRERLSSQARASISAAADWSRIARNVASLHQEAARRHTGDKS